MAANTTERALAECKRRGWPAAVVEKWIPYRNRRKDVFGFGDLLVIDGRPGSLLVQVTSTGNMASRVSKIVSECSRSAMAWLAMGNRIEVWGWAKRGAAGARKLWTLRVTVVDAEMIHAAANKEAASAASLEGSGI